MQQYLGELNLGTCAEEPSELNMSSSRSKREVEPGHVCRSSRGFNMDTCVTVLGELECDSHSTGGVAAVPWELKLE
ncbi:hypothetical protein DPMN_143868 [Dreissena polymorpha]|uniref:Uncharacterized protein n=1 Tax=Dreissena polymorpha TaxID=45954 RepID=A0A9D4JK29_DREPO|nr:hypothetical protein DPMN_143868 [Dreissena polymorpha]